MRIRLFGQHLHLSFFALAAAETGLFFGLLIAAGLVRLGPHLALIDRAEGPLWPRAVVFSLSLVASKPPFDVMSLSTGTSVPVSGVATKPSNRNPR